MIELAKLAGGLVLDWFKSKREEKQAVHERRMQVIANTQEIDLFNTQNAGSSWKDEYWTLILSIPAIGAFVPSWVPTIQEGFEALETMPGWYITALMASVAASFGYRGLVQYRKRKTEESR